MASMSGIGSPFGVRIRIVTTGLASVRSCETGHGAEAWQTQRMLTLAANHGDSHGSALRSVDGDDSEAKCSISLRLPLKKWRFVHPSLVFGKRCSARLRLRSEEHTSE